MAAVKELIRTEEDGTLSFGNYTLAEKTKLEDFEFQGNLYKVKTFAEITKLERDGMFVYESVPGTAVEHFSVSSNEVSFQISGIKDSQFTLGLESENEYTVYMDGNNVGDIKTNLSGKLSVSVELDADKVVEVKVVKK